MQFISRVSKSGIAKVLALALVLSSIVSFVGLSSADHTAFWGPAFNFDVTVKDQTTNQPISGVNLLLVADNHSHPDHGLSAVTDSAGRAHLNVHRGGFNFEMRHPNYNAKDIRINFIGNTTVNAVLTPGANPTPPPTNPPPPNPGPIIPDPEPFPNPTPPGPGPTPTPTPTPTPAPGCTPTPPNGRAVLNYWPISESGVGCTDFSMLAAKNVTRGTGYVVNSTLSAEDDEIIRFQIYVHNGTVDLPENIAHNLMVKLNQSGRGTVSAEAWANDANRIVSSSKGGNINLDIAHGEHLEVIPGSGKVYSRSGSLVGSISAESVDGSGASLGDMRGCFEFARFVTIDFRVVEPVVTPTTGTLTVTKQVINDNGGTATVADFPLFINSTRVTSGAANTLTAGTYTVSETNRSGYTASFSGACNANGVVNLAASQNLTCVITNNDIAPPPTTGTITVVKQVINDNGGTAQVSNFPLFINNTQVSSGQRVTLTAGTYTVSETNRSGYTASFSGACNSTGRVTLGVGQNLTCTITNNDIPPIPTTGTITVIKQVINDNGGTATVADFPLFINSTRVTSGAANTLTAGTYTVSETNRSGYTASFSGACNANGVVNLGVGQSAVCTITNNDVAPVPAFVDIQKLVRNVSDNQSIFTDSTAAEPGEQVEFQLQVTASGNTVRNININDALPSRLNYVNNSLRINGVAAGNNLAAIDLNNMTVGETKMVTFRTNVAASSEFSEASTSLTNIANLTSSAGSDMDTAQVIVHKFVVGINPFLTINKQVKNISQNQSGFVETTTANPGDQVEFRIEVTANESTAQNVTVTDVLPNNFTLNFATAGDGVTQVSSTSFNFGNMGPGVTRTVLLRATAASEGSFPVGSSSWVNTATASSSNTASVSDTASVIVNRQTTVTPNAFLQITKQVRNVTQGTSFADSTTARGNERVQYRIEVRSTGNTTANNVRLTDILPSNISFVSGTALLDNSNYSGDVNNVFLGNMSQGAVRTLVFEATVANINFSTSLTNTATATADNAPSVNDTATVFVSSVAGGNINLVLSKRAFNVTQGKDATTVTANAGDVIDYILSVHNTGNATATGFVIEDNLADVLQLSSLIQNGGGTLFGDVLRWNGVDIAAGAKIEKIFTVRVKSPIPSGTDFVMTNVYGNTVNVSVRSGQVLGTFTAPKTGSPITLSIIMALATMAGIVGVNRFKKQKGIEINRIA